MIHKYKMNGFNIVMDINSGAIHIFDDLAYDMLDNLDENMEETVPEQVYNEHSEKHTVNYTICIKKVFCSLRNNIQAT